MAFDEGLAERIRDVLIGTPRISERRMFGGVAFLADGHMFVGIIGDVLMARVGPENYAAALKRKHVREMDFTGKPMKGYVYVDPAGIAGDEELEEWVMRCRAFVKTLPPQAPERAVAEGQEGEKSEVGHRFAMMHWNSTLGTAAGVSSGVRSRRILLDGNVAVGRVTIECCGSQRYTRCNTVKRHAGCSSLREPVGDMLRCCA